MAVDGGRGGVEVEVARSMMLVVRDGGVFDKGKETLGVTVLPVVCDTNDSLVALIADEFDLILDVQNRLVVFLASCVPDLAFDGSRVSFFSILAQICELHSLFPIPINGDRTVKVLFTPSLSTSMQAIGTIIGMQGI